MWNDQKRKRFNELREPDRQLGQAEREELEVLMKDLEDMESDYLAPATERLRQERIAINKRSARLENVIQRKKAFAARLDNIIAEAEHERLAIENELASVLADRDAVSEDQ